MYELNFIKMLVNSSRFKFSPYLISIIYHNLAITYYEMGHNEKSEKYFDIAIKQRKLAKDRRGLDKSKLFLVRVKIGLKKYQKFQMILKNKKKM